jgi:ADP-ribosyl-[dinitrogen reductase] hydrolase
LIERRSRLLGSLYGLLVGDALGVPYEFHRPAALPPQHEIEMEPPPGFWRAHRGTPPGTWSDDGALALALLDALLDEGRPDANAIALRIVAWAREGRYAVDGRVFDIGRQTGIAVERIEQGVSPLQSGGTDEYANGNGSLMRVAPLALWHRGTDAELAEAAHLQSLPTHAHPRSQVACALLSLTLRRILDGDTAPDEALNRVADWLAAHYAERPGFAAELQEVMRAPEREEPTGSGYVVDTLWSALHAVRGRDFEGALRAAIAFGHDTDTTACVAGALAGALHGIEPIPSRWMQALRGREIVEPLAGRLLSDAL